MMAVFLQWQVAAYFIGFKIIRYLKRVPHVKKRSQMENKRGPAGNHPYNLRQAMSRFERGYLSNILELTQWDRAKAAKRGKNNEIKDNWLFGDEVLVRFEAVAVSVRPAAQSESD